jgi:hypothetical protein
MTARPAWLPGRRTVVSELTTAAVVGATLYVLDGSLPYAAAAGAAFLALQLVATVAENAVGDYADNALYGGLVLAATAYAIVLTTPWWLVAAGAILGGCFLADGVQHLRHGVSRRAVGFPTTHDGNALTGLVKALVTRLAAPLLLESSGQS